MFKVLGGVNKSNSSLYACHCSCFYSATVSSMSAAELQHFYASHPLYVSVFVFVRRHSVRDSIQLSVRPSALWPVETRHQQSIYNPETCSLACLEVCACDVACVHVYSALSGVHQPPAAPLLANCLQP